MTTIRQVAGANLVYHLGLAVGELRIAEDRAGAYDYFDPDGVSGGKMIF